MTRGVWVFSLGVLALGAVVAAEVPAFPGAQGFGAKTPGGRGGRVLEVTNLDASGPGSFRAACEAQGPRIIVFRVGGTIVTDRDIRIRDPFVTIAGQTAPGDGICLRGAGLRIHTHDVIVRGLRIRVGDDPKGPSPDNRDGIGIEKTSGAGNDEVRDIILDHCSVSWAIDGNVDTWYACRNITVQWSILSEGLTKSLHAKGEHGTGLLVGDRAQRVSVHHNLFAHNSFRNPLFKNDTSGEAINNVVYNWRWESSRLAAEANRGPSFVNLMGNFYKPGTDSRKNAIDVSQRLHPDTRVHVDGNVGARSPGGDVKEWEVVFGAAGFRSLAPAITPSGIAPEPARRAYERVLNHAGAITPRDRVDARVVASVREDTGRLIDSPRDVGGWPVYATAPAPQDTDHDGMPDAWERAHGLNPSDLADSRADRNQDGYTNVEEYINGLIPGEPDPGRGFSRGRS